MTGPAEPTRYAFEYPDEAGHPDEEGTLGQDQAVLIDEVLDDPHAPAFDFAVVNDEQAGIYDAIVGDREIAGLTYNVAGDDRLVLLAALVYPEFRKQGIATELIRRVLDDVRAQGKTVTILCPIVRTFIEHNPEYADLIDPAHPGVTKGFTPVLNPPISSPTESVTMTINLEAEAVAREENNAAIIAALDKSGLSEVESSWELDVINDAEHGRWIATLGAEAIAELPYRFVGGRVVLLTTWVDPAYRNHRVATELVSRVLDEIRESGKKITIICPVVGEFIARHPEYTDLIDKIHPGSGAYPKHEPVGGQDDEQLTAFERDLG
ncbi:MULTISPECIES: GNAT family N-acetyltransferase [unclassified Micromonospora]|uniref:GNAT family N-acetyltransferase n=1 Tax=unclassified Micromonospora TaxID=2617518 RepID=UPI0033AFC4AC